MDDRHTLLGATVIVVVLAAFAGVSGPFDAGVGDAADESEPDPDQLVERLVTDPPEAIDGELEETTVRNDTVVERTTYEVVYRPEPHEMRVRISGPGTETTLVQNRTHLWMYDGEENELTRGNLSEFEHGFVVPALEHDHDPDLVDEFEATHEGTEHVAGREAYALRFEEPQTNDAAIELLIGGREYRVLETRFDEPLVLVDHQLWIDRERHYPLLERTVLETPEGDSLVYETRYDRIEFELPEEPDPFHFDPAEDLEDVEDADPDEIADFPEYEVESYESIEAARAATSVRIPEPRVPDSYRFEEVRVTTLEDSERVHLHYADGEETVRVAAAPDATFDPRGVGVAVGDERGTITESGGDTWLYWECDGTLFWIAGAVDADEAVSIAESIECG